MIVVFTIAYFGFGASALVGLATSNFIGGLFTAVAFGYRFKLLTLQIIVQGLAFSLASAFGLGVIGWIALLLIGGICAAMYVIAHPIAPTKMNWA